jgi:DNA repair protein RAD50
LKTDIAGAKHDDRIADLNIKIRTMEDQRDNLTLEIRTLSLQSDARAKLTLHQRDLASKEREMKNMYNSYRSLHRAYLTPVSLQISSAKFSKLVGAEASVDTMESEVNAAITFVVDSKCASISTDCA